MTFALNRSVPSFLPTRSRSSQVTLTMQLQLYKLADPNYSHTESTATWFSWLQGSLSSCDSLFAALHLLDKSAGMYVKLSRNDQETCMEAAYVHP